MLGRTSRSVSSLEVHDNNVDDFGVVEICCCCYVTHALTNTNTCSTNESLVKIYRTQLHYYASKQASARYEPYNRWSDGNCGFIMWIFERCRSIMN